MVRGPIAVTNEDGENGLDHDQKARFLIGGRYQCVERLKIGFSTTGVTREWSREFRKVDPAQAGRLRRRRITSF